VRGETLGTKRLVHNYGHGGAGISLCWGTARLATLIGLPGQSGPVAVIGAGVAGLTTARLVQEAGFPVTVYAKAVTPHTTSDVAGGQWLPTGYFDYDAIDDAFRVRNGAAVDYSYRRYQLLVGEEYGVRWITNYFETRPPGGEGPDSGSPTQPDWRRLASNEHPFPLEHVRQHKLMLIEPPRFLRQLMRDIQIAGGRIAIRSFAAVQEVAALPETLVFNCTGLGAKELFGDPQLIPVRGQLVTLLPQPEVDYALGTRTGYMFPRRDGIVLGGTFQPGRTSTDPDPATTDRILASHKAVFDAFRCPPAAT
jgi:glycine/D-amino acid oxidase-like deaminating enzyme